MYDFSTFPTLRTERLTLDRITTDDRQALYDLFSDEQVTRFNDVETFKSLTDAEWLIRFLERRFDAEAGLRWAIRLTDAPKLIGTAGYNSWMRDVLTAEIGYDLLPFYWNRGIMTETLKAVIAFGFDHMALNRVEADVVVGNGASVRVLEKLGFTQEGILRQGGVWKGQFHDLHLFSLLRSDLREKGISWAGRSSTS